MFNTQITMRESRPPVVTRLRGVVLKDAFKCLSCKQEGQCGKSHIPPKENLDPGEKLTLIPHAFNCSFLLIIVFLFRATVITFRSSTSTHVLLMFPVSCTQEAISALMVTKKEKKLNIYTSASPHARI